MKMQEYNIKEEHIYLTKNSLKKRIEQEIERITSREIEEDAGKKSKVNHWKSRKPKISPGKRPPYIEKLTRKQCNAIIKARSRMIPVKTNQKDAHQDTICRLCKEAEETQEHILTECPTNDSKIPDGIKYIDLFDDSDDNVDNLKVASNSIIKTIEHLEERARKPTIGNKDK